MLMEINFTPEQIREAVNFDCIMTREELSELIKELMLDNDIFISDLGLDNEVFCSMITLLKGDSIEDTINKFSEMVKESYTEDDF